MKAQKIYVIIPVYNMKLYLRRCIESILNQTYTNFEIILVDDGSTDESGSICDDYAERYENIVVIHQNNKGVSGARNTGIQYAQQSADLENTWICFVDSDDYVHPYYLEYLYKATMENNVKISSCGNIRTSEKIIEMDQDIAFKVDLLSPEEYWCKKHTNAGIIWGKLYQSSVLKDIVYPEGKLYEDGYVTYKILFQYEKIAIVWTKLYIWCINPGSITQSSWTPKQIDAIYALEAQIEFFEKNGYKEAYKPTLRFLIWHSVKQLRDCKRASSEYKNYLPELRRKRNKAMKLLIKDIGFTKASWYWFEITIWKYIKRKLKR